MFDSCRRDIHYLRLSVTDRCNLRCRYCMPDGAKILEHEEVLTHDEFLRLAALFAQCGIDTVMCRNTAGSSVSRLMFTLSRPASSKAGSCCASRVPLVVMLT